MNDTQLIQQSARKLSEYFSDESLCVLNTYEEVHQKLTQSIVYLLLNNMELLLQILYRIDVSEQATKAAFAQNNPREIAPELARLIIERELKKTETRIKYSQR